MAQRQSPGWRADYTCEGCEGCYGCDRCAGAIGAPMHPAPLAPLCTSRTFSHLTKLCYSQCLSALRRPPQSGDRPLKTAPIAQLDRASGYEPGGRTFESCWAHQPPLWFLAEAVGRSREARRRTSPLASSFGWQAKRSRCHESGRIGEGSEIGKDPLSPCWPLINSSSSSFANAHTSTTSLRKLATGISLRYVRLPQ